MMRALFTACLSLGLVAGASAASAATPSPAPGLIHLVSGDGLDRDAAATGNDRTGGMWENATGGAYGASMFRGGQTYSPHWAHYHRHRIVHRYW